MTQQPWGNPQWGANQPPQQPRPGAQWGAPGAWPAPAGQPWPGQFAAPNQRPGYPQQPQQYAQPSYYPQPGGYQPPRPPSSGGGLRVLIVAAIGAIVVVGFAITLWSFIATPQYVAGPGTQTTYAPLPTEAPPTTQPPPPTEPPNVEVPAPDKNPSDLPAPENYAEATALMEKNPAYAESVAIPTDCAVDAVDVQTASVDALEKHLNGLTACLWRVWSPPLVAAGFEMPRPPVTVFTSKVTTACGKMDDLVNAVYCGADQRVYYGKLLYVAIPKELRKTPFIADTVIAHEFGHAIQARTGILISEKAWEDKSSKEEALVLSRRTEMQADCLAGMFTGSVAAANNLSPADLKNLGLMIYNLGDDVLAGDPTVVADHGTGKARQSWYVAGGKSDQLKTCNTYTAPASKVR